MDVAFLLDRAFKRIVEPRSFDEDDLRTLVWLLSPSSNPRRHFHYVAHYVAGRMALNDIVETMRNLLGESVELDGSFLVLRGEAYERAREYVERRLAKDSGYWRELFTRNEKERKAIIPRRDVRRLFKEIVYFVMEDAYEEGRSEGLLPDRWQTVPEGPWKAWALERETGIRLDVAGLSNYLRLRKIVEHYDRGELVEDPRSFVEYYVRTNGAPFVLFSYIERRDGKRTESFLVERGDIVESVVPLIKELNEEKKRNVSISVWTVGNALRESAEEEIRPNVWRLKGRNKKEDARLTRFIVLDFDFHLSNGRPDDVHLWRIAGFLERISSDPAFAERLVFVLSGGGVHLWIPMKRAIDEKEKWEEVVRKLSIMAKMEFGLPADVQMAEASRVMRVPGTINWKYGRRAAYSLPLLEPLLTFTALLEKVKDVEDDKDVVASGRSLRLNQQTVEGNGKIEVREDRFPPCIVQIIERARRGENLTHAERLVLLFFLLNLGLSDEEIIEYYRNVPDFNEKKTRYFIAHARKRGYKPYSCEKIRELGLCPASKCDVENVRTPFGVYLRKLRLNEQTVKGNGKSDQKRTKKRTKRRSSRRRSSRRRRR